VHKECIGGVYFCGVIKRNYNKKITMNRYYEKNTKIDFGMYKGYELGVVFLFDPRYIDWCINNIDDFCVGELANLANHYVINIEVDSRIRLINEPHLIEGIDLFDTFDEFIQNYGFEDMKYSFSEETLKINRNNERLYAEDDIDYDYDEWDNSSSGCFIDDDLSVCDDNMEWESQFARDNGFYPDGSGYRPDC